MVTEQQRSRWRADKDLLARAAEKVRREASAGQAEAAAGRAPVLPVERYVVVELLDELALAAGRGELSRGLRTVALEMADVVLQDQSS